MVISCGSDMIRLIHISWVMRLICRAVTQTEKMENELKIAYICTLELGSFEFEKTLFNFV